MGSQAAAEDALVGDLSFIQDKALQRYKAVVGSEGERWVVPYVQCWVETVMKQTQLNVGTIKC